MQYIIYEYQKQYRDLFARYPHLENSLSHLKEDNSYCRALKSTLYHDLSFLDQLVYDKLQHRQEYVKKGHLHILYHPLTGQKSTFLIKNNKIYIHSLNKNNIFFYIIYQNLKYYVIIEKKL